MPPTNPGEWRDGAPWSGPSPAAWLEGWRRTAVLVVGAVLALPPFGVLASEAVGRDWRGAVVYAGSAGVLLVTVVIALVQVVRRRRADLGLWEAAPGPELGPLPLGLALGSGTAALTAGVGAPPTAVVTIGVLVAVGVLALTWCGRWLVREPSPPR